MSVGARTEHPILESPLGSRFFSLPDGVRLIEPASGSPGVTYPAGFLASGIAVGLKHSGKRDVGVITVAPAWRETAVSDMVSTSNAFAAAPVIITREEADRGRLLAVVINSGNANACTGSNGLAVARAMQRACADALGIPVRSTAVGSTGIIGAQLETSFMAEAVTKAAAAVQESAGAAFSRAIMTTDRYAKECALELDLPNGTVRLAACAKGAGMIAPAMATMLCVVTTDALLQPGDVEGLLRPAVDQTFNKITVDGEMSTNDSVYFLASGASGVRPSGAGKELFVSALQTLLLRLSLMMVADGEGATKIIKVTVRGADDDASAALVCRAVAGSPLVKTAMHGGDPNWGRVISSAGAALPGCSLPDARLWLCGVQVVEKSAAREIPREEWNHLVASMKEREVEIDLDLGVGRGQADLYFADLGHEYITINAEYHT
ncbi:MAG: bifunctional glutamate N-acetyltransferase/amino-acid acetyltransferase ArgJ [Thermoleophilia bacterium]|jgi:glutamate N-acetyltransferase/amino-acid N-acetyltransferase